ncbi:MAG: acyltransferase [Acidobacteria bacterium]|nr:acyltransferase [Acidobacteriota bacterium]
MTARSLREPRRLWMRVWMRLAGDRGLGRIAMRVASWAAPPHRAQNELARLSSGGFISPRATIHHPRCHRGRHTFIAEGVVIFSRDGSGEITIGDRVQLYRESFIETGENGTIGIADDVSVHARCQLMAYKGSIHIGRGASLAYGCALYPYDHGIAPEVPIRRQPLVTKGDITIGEEAWLGTNVTVLSGVTIGTGAVVAAGSVVMRDVPPYAIAAGTPARVIGFRQLAGTAQTEAPMDRRVGGS